LAICGNVRWILMGSPHAGSHVAVTPPYVELDVAPLCEIHHYAARFRDILSARQLFEQLSENRSCPWIRIFPAWLAGWHRVWAFVKLNTCCKFAPHQIGNQQTSSDFSMSILSRRRCLRYQRAMGVVLLASEFPSVFVFRWSNQIKFESVSSRKDQALPVWLQCGVLKQTAFLLWYSNSF
jgi:hypothetical protein